MDDPASIQIMRYISDDIKTFSYMRGTDFDPRVKSLTAPPTAKILKIGEPLLEESPFVIRDYQFNVELRFPLIQEITLENNPEHYVQPIAKHFGGDKANFPFRGVTKNKNNRIAFKVLDVLYLGIPQSNTSIVVYSIPMSLPVAPERFAICNNNEEF